ncbi:MAG: hypothetical protein IK013_04930 [Bacteroidales bacterium]|nr:hypothetical protein [Bacteroidales bacterium]
MQLHGQARDTIYVVEEKIVYDTVYMHDTIYYPMVAEPDTPVAPTRTTAFVPEIFKGFHLGYVFQYQLMSPAELINSDGEKSLIKSRPGSGYVGGLEFSYHFAKYFGVSAGINLGSHYACNIRYEDAVYIGEPAHFRFSMFGISVPLKFEFHMPFNSRFWLVADIGARFSTPYPYSNSGSFSSVGLLYDDQSFSYPIETEYYSQIKNERRINTGFLMDLGFYYQLKNNGLLRFTLGTNLSPAMFWHGCYTYSTQDVVVEEGTVSFKNQYIYPQIAYIHTFQKHKEKEFHKVPWYDEVSPGWSDEKTFHRHEFQFNVGIPNLQSEYSSLVMFTIFSDWFPKLYKKYLISQEEYNPYNWTLTSDTYSKVRYTPVISLSYHYRAYKWLWVGLTADFSEFYAYYYDRLTDKRVKGQSEHNTFFDLMADLRFSYLNRKHVTLYSELSGGLLIGNFTSKQVQPVATNYTAFAGAVHVTMLGVKAGAKGWFGNVELGAGFKGLISAGFGYEF